MTNSEFFPLHPALVHFPIALLFAAGVFYVWAMWREGNDLYQAGWYLHLAGIVGTVLAIFSGLSSQDGLDLTEEVEGYLQTHTLLGYAVGWAFGLLAVWQYLRQGKGSKSEKIAFVICYALGLGLLVYSSWLGGHMVYEHGVGVNLK